MTDNNDAQKREQEKALADMMDGAPWQYNPSRWQEALRYQHSRIKALKAALVEAAVPLETLWGVENDSQWIAPELKQSIAKAVKAIRTVLGVSTEGL